MGSNSPDSGGISSKSFLRSKEELELELEKARVEAQAAELKLKALELDRQLKKKRRKEKFGEARDQVLAPTDGSISEPVGREDTPPPESVESVSKSTESVSSGTESVSKSTAEPVPSANRIVQGEAEQPSVDVKTPRKDSTRHSLPKSKRDPDAPAPNIPVRRSKPENRSRKTAKVVRAGSLADPGRKPAIDRVEEKRDAERYGSRVHRMFRSMPSWLISAIAHVIILLVFALLVMPLPLKSSDIFITREADTSQNEEFEEVEFETDPLEEIEEMETEPVEFDDMGLADLGEFASLTNVAEVSEAGVSGGTSSPTEIGSLFGADGSGLGDAGKGLGGAQFFGAKAGGTRFAFVVDRSASMRHDERWEAALHELFAAVSRMDPKQSFFVIFFAGDPYAMFDQHDPEPNLLRATKSNIGKLETWLHTIEMAPSGVSSNVDKALDHVLKMRMRPDAIFLLTDGRIPKRTETFLKKVNSAAEDPIFGRVQQTAVHTIGFSKEGEAMLRRIAETNGGTYTFYEPPKTPGRRRRT